MQTVPHDAFYLLRGREVRTNSRTAAGQIPSPADGGTKLSVQHNARKTAQMVHRPMNTDISRQPSSNN